MRKEDFSTLLRRFTNTNSCKSSGMEHSFRRASDGRIEQLLIFRLNEQLDRRTEKKVERRNDCRNGSIRLLIS